jgi:phosphopantetheinyl transferase (holo-ACP synthase)
MIFGIGTDVVQLKRVQATFGVTANTSDVC